MFDKISQDDLIMAFFPCIRFENQIMLAFRGQAHGMEKWDYRRKMLHDMELLDELKHNYDLVQRYWCYPPEIIDKDRRLNGDLLKKPTQYWFLNCEPKQNLIFEPLQYTEFTTKDAVRQMSRKDADIIGARTIKQARSTIHPQYANRFIRQYLIDEEEIQNAQ